MAGRDSRGLTRRSVALRLAAMAAPAMVAGCGFEPLYRRGAGGNPGPAARELAAVSVDVIGDRPGQLLRQALQQRLEGSGSAAARRYALAVDYTISGEGIAIRQDTAVTRIRLVARARWILRAEDAARTELVRDTARSVDDVNILNEQYFASDLETETAQRRLAETLADQIVLQLAVYFRGRPERAAAS